jgi:hypothetical protein
MTDNPTNPALDQAATKARSFFKEMFSTSIPGFYGDIEVRAFPKGGRPIQFFCKTIDQAVEVSMEQCALGYPSVCAPSSLLAHDIR